MTSLDIDNRERHTFIDRTISKAFEEFQDPKIQQTLGEYAVWCSDVLANAIIANIVDGEIQLPASYDFDEEPLPVVAMRPDDKLVLSEVMDTQTQTQTNNTLAVFEKWEPRRAAILTIYDRLMRHPQDPGQRAEVSMHGLTEAMTGTSAVFISESKLQHWFYNAPIKASFLLKIVLLSCLK